MNSSQPSKWWSRPRKASAVLMNSAAPPRYALRSYGSHQLEIKSLPDGWQVIVTKDGGYVSNGHIKDDLATALNEAHEFIDKL